MNKSKKYTNSDKDIKFSLILNSLFTVVEFIFGLLTGSLSLIADATHNLADVITLGVSFVANRLSRRKANKSKTFGYGRITILAALLNATTMLIIAGFIIAKAIERLAHPQPVEGGIIVIIALIGVAVNGSIAYVLSKHTEDLNMRSAYIDMLFDALSSIGAVVAGVLIMITGVTGVDSMVGILIALLLLYNVFQIIKEATHILLEGTPKGVDIAKITKAIKSAKNVVKVDDLHIWSIRSSYNALSCHIIIDKKDLPNSRIIVDEIKKMLREKHNIHHTTIEIELKESINHNNHESH